MTERIKGLSVKDLRLGGRNDKMDKRIPVVTLKSVEETTPVLKALRAYGINCAEITFRTSCAEEAIKAAVREFPDMNIGAGTGSGRALLSRLRDADGDHEGDFFRIDHSQIFPRGRIRRSEGFEGAFGALSAGEVYSYGRHQQGQH